MVSKEDVQSIVAAAIADARQKLIKELSSATFYPVNVELIGGVLGGSADEGLDAWIASCDREAPSAVLQSPKYSTRSSVHMTASLVRKTSGSPPDGWSIDWPSVIPHDLIPGCEDPSDPKCWDNGNGVRVFLKHTDGRRGFLLLRQK